MDKFDTSIKRLCDAGGTRPIDSELKQDLLDILPQEFRESLMWLADRPDTYLHFREHVLTKAAEVLDNRGKLGAIHSVEEELAEVMAIDNGSTAIPQLKPGVLEKLEEILAVARGGGG